MTGERVLVIDDHPGFRRTLRRLLETEGWTVVGEAADGASAVAMGATLRPDIVLVDIGLPDVDGFEVAERLARMPDGGPTIVLISSRDATAYDTRLATSAAVGFLTKGDLDGAALHALLGR